VIRAISMMLVGILCLLGGGPALQLALTERQPTALECGVFEPADRFTRWLQLSGCRLSWSEAGYATVGKSVTEVYVPVRSRSELVGAPVRMVLASRRAVHLELGEALLAAHGDAEGMQRALKRHRAETRVYDVLRGIWRELREVSSAEQEVIRGLPVTLADGVGVLDDEATPDVAVGLALFAVGVACLLLAGRGLGRRRRWQRRGGAL
jgi:hypothetical protein